MRFILFCAANAFDQFWNNIWTGNKWGSKQLPRGPPCALASPACAKNLHCSWHFQIAYQYIGTENPQAQRDPVISTAVLARSLSSIFPSWAPISWLQTFLQRLSISIPLHRLHSELWPLFTWLDLCSLPAPGVPLFPVMASCLNLLLALAHQSCLPEIYMPVSKSLMFGLRAGWAV